MAAISLPMASAFASALARAADEEAARIWKPVELCGPIESVVDDRESPCVKFANVGRARSKGEVACAANDSSCGPVGTQRIPCGTVTAFMRDSSSRAAALASAIERL